MVFAPLSTEDTLKKFNIVRIGDPRIIEMVDPNHAMVKLADTLDWKIFDERFSPLFSPAKRRPPVSTRVIVAVLYIKHTFNLSDEESIARIQENLYWQYFCGREYFDSRPVCDSTTLVKWRQRMGERGVEVLLQETLRAAESMKIMKKSDLDDVIVDTTVQEKNVAFPTDAKLLNRARESLVKMAKEVKVELRQNYNREAKWLVAKYARYAHAKQFNRARKVRKRLQTILGRLLRDLSRKSEACTWEAKFSQRYSIAQRIHSQMTTGKNKVYSVHAPEVECISKGKAHKRYEFGCKASLATTNRFNWIVGAKALHGRPYDGHTIGAALNQIKSLVGKYPSRIYLDKGYRGCLPPDPDITSVYISGQKRAISKLNKRRLKRRSAVEPVIGHLKRGHRLGRNFLKGTLGDQINVILAAAGHNMSKLLAALFVQKILQVFFQENYKFIA